MLLIAVPADAVLAGALLVERVSLSDRSMSLLLHAVASMFLSALISGGSGS
jgi:hypothetical protein